MENQMDEQYIVKSEIDLAGNTLFQVIDTQSNKVVKSYVGKGAMTDAACQDAFALAYELNNCGQ